MLIVKYDVANFFQMLYMVFLAIFDWSAKSADFPNVVVIKKVNHIYVFSNCVIKHKNIEYNISLIIKVSHSCLFRIEMAATTTKSEEPPAKRKSIDFSLCLMCQQKGNLILEPTLSAYENFLISISKRAEYGNSEFVKLKKHLYSLSAEDLAKNQASWHRSCYSEATHKQHTERDKIRWEKALGKQDSSILSCTRVGRPVSNAATSQDTSLPLTKRVTRSQVQAFNKEVCFYCQDIKYDGSNKEEKLHECSSLRIGNSIREIVEASDNNLWKVHLADISERDFLSKQIKYHKTCHTNHWYCYVQQPRRSSKDKNNNEKITIEFISAEIEYIAELKQRLDNGEFSTMNEIVTLHRRMMNDHGIEESCISPQAAVKKVQESMPDVIVTPGSGRKPSVIHF